MCDAQLRAPNDPPLTPAVSSPEHTDILDTTHAGPAAIRGGVLRVAGYGAGILLTTVSAALLFRHLGVADGGRYVTVMAIVTIASGLVDFGLATIGVRELAVRHATEHAEIFRNLLGLRIVLSFAGLAAAIAFVAVAGYPKEMVAGTVLAGIGMFIASAQTTIGTPLMVKLRLGWVTTLELVRQAIVAVTIVVLVLAGAGLVVLLASPIPAAVVVLVATVVLIRTEVPVRPSFQVRSWGAVLREMLPFAAATAVNAVYFRASLILLSLIASARETGYFAAPFRVIEVLLLVPNIIVGAAFPIFARAAHGDRERLAYATQRVFEACVVAGGWLAVTLIAGAPFVIEVIAGSDFAPSADVLRIQATALMVTFSGASFFYALLSLRRHGVLLALTLGALAVNLALVGILGSADGARGAAVGVLCAEVVLVTLGGVAISRADSRLRPSLVVIPRVVPAVAAAFAVLLVPGVPDWVAMLWAAAVFPVVALVARAVPAEVIVEARRVLRPTG